MSNRRSPIAPGLRRSLRCGAGFTLIEVLIALAILAISAVALLQLQMVSVRLCDRAARETRAGFLAQARLAELLAAGFPEVGTSSGSFMDDPDFGWTVTVGEVRDAALDPLDVAADLRSVSVRVHWADGEQQKQVEVTTVAADRGARATQTN